MDSIRCGMMKPSSFTCHVLRWRCFDSPSMISICSVTIIWSPRLRIQLVLTSRLYSRLHTMTFLTWICFFDSWQVGSIRQGFRSVPLKNTFSEHLELASLLIHVVSLHQVGHFNFDWKFLVVCLHSFAKSYLGILSDKLSMKKRPQCFISMNNSSYQFMLLF